MKSIIISIRPDRIEKIFAGEATIEIRKTAPREFMDLEPHYQFSRNKDIDVYIYCTNIGKPFVEKPFAKMPINGSVVAKFKLSEIKKIVLNEEEKFVYSNSIGNPLVDANIEYDELCDYLGYYGFSGQHKNLFFAYAWTIKDLDVFAKPKNLYEFGLNKTVHSWQRMEM